MYSRRILSLSESMTIAISTLAKRLKAEGRNILAFSAGEPDFDTPDFIKQEGIKAIQEGMTKYTPVAGIPELLQAIAEKLRRENGLVYETNEILTSNGAKHALFNLFQAVIDEGDEVIIPAPYWVTYPELVRYNGGTNVHIATDESTEFKITPEQLKGAVTDKTKMLILTTPSNPTGATYTRAELEALAEILKGTDIMVCADEIYEKLIYEGEFTSVASLSEDMFKRTITVNGLSKSVSMTGWRFGYLATPNKELIKKMTGLQSQCTTNICSITQKAAIAGLDGRAEADVTERRLVFLERRDLAVELFNAIPGISVEHPKGAFYLFVNIKEITNDSMTFCQRLLEEQGVALVPGIGFGTEGYFRFSFAADSESIKEGIARIRVFAENYAA